MDISVYILHTWFWYLYSLLGFEEVPLLLLVLFPLLVPPNRCHSESGTNQNEGQIHQGTGD